MKREAPARAKRALKNVHDSFREMNIHHVKYMKMARAVFKIKPVIVPNLGYCFSIFVNSA